MTEVLPIAEVLRRLRQTMADGPPAWLVGGAVRERLRGHDSDDLDVAIAGEDAARTAARTLARATGGHAFALSDAFGAWRVVGTLPDGGHPPWQVDLTPLQGTDLPADLACRDLTVNAIAEPLAGGPLIDPFGGQEDLAAGRLRMVTPQAFAADPVRVLRLARFAVDLSARPEPATLAAAREAAPRLTTVPGERLLLELTRIFVAPGWAAGVEVLEITGALQVLFPSAVTADGFLSRTTAARLRAVLDPTFSVPEASAADRSVLVARVGAPDRRTALGLTGLVADAPDPGQAIDPLRPSRALRTAVARIVAAGPRILALDGATATPRTLFDALHPCGDDAPEALLWARVLSDDPRVPWAALAERAVRWIERPPTAPIRGDVLAGALGLTPGPELGRLLQDLAIAHDAGEVTTPDDAVAWARRARSADPPGG